MDHTESHNQPRKIGLQQLEEHILSHGAFAPLAFLLDEGLLPYTVYSEWRTGERSSLDGAFTQADEKILDLLVGLFQRCQALGLSAEEQCYYPWGDSRAEALRFSRRDTLNGLLSQRWQRGDNVPQLDLFLDNSVIATENTLLSALANLDHLAAEQAYQSLCLLAPNHAHLGELEALTCYAGHIEANPLIAGAELLEEEIEGLEREVAPLARERLRSQCRDYLGRAWARLAQNLVDEAYSPQLPKHHASYAWLQIPDWEKVRDSVLSEPGFEEHPTLLNRLATAFYFTGAQENAMLVSLRLLNTAPEQAKAFLDAHPDPGLQKLWQHFGDIEAIDTDDHFAAWVLLRRPELLHHLEQAPVTAPTGPSFEATKALLLARRHQEDEIPHRENLQACCPALLRQYLTSL